MGLDAPDTNRQLPTSFVRCRGTGNPSRVMSVGTVLPLSPFLAAILTLLPLILPPCPSLSLSLSLSLILHARAYTKTFSLFLIIFSHATSLPLLSVAPPARPPSPSLPGGKIQPQSGLRTDFHPPPRFHNQTRGERGGPRQNPLLRIPPPFPPLSVLPKISFPPKIKTVDLIRPASCKGFTPSYL